MEKSSIAHTRRTQVLNIKCKPQNQRRNQEENCNFHKEKKKRNLITYDIKYVPQDHIIHRYK